MPVLTAARVVSPLLIAAALVAPATAQLAARTHLVTAANRFCFADCDTALAGSWSVDDGNSVSFSTANWNPPGSAGVYYDSPPYDDLISLTPGSFTHYIRGVAGMPLGAAFNVLTIRYLERSCIFFHFTTPGNTTGDTTRLSRSSLNGTPSAFVLVQPLWNDNVILNVGLFYNFLGNHWDIFTEDHSAMPNDGLGFAVYDGTCNIGLSSQQQLTCSSAAGNHCALAGVATGNPAARLLVTQRNFTGTSNPHNIGVYYQSGTWNVFNQDLFPMPATAQFDVAVVAVLLAASFEDGNLLGWSASH